MIKKILILLIIIVHACIVSASNCTITCPKESTQIIEKETLFNKLTGLNFASKKIAETIIEKELKDELNSKFKAQAEIFSIKRLKQGEFKSLTLQSSRIRALFMSDFYAQTICPYNKIIYKKNRIYYPVDLPFKFKSKITNDDIKSVINSYEFQRELEKNSLFEIKTPSTIIKDNKIYFEIPIKTILGEFKIKFSALAEIENNKLVLKNININSKSNIINDNILSKLTDKINPIVYGINSINTKYCKIYLTNVKIIDNEIHAEGVFIINKNM